MKNIDFIVYVKHFVWVKPPTFENSGQIQYDHEEQFIFSYDGKLRISGTSWNKECTPEEVADVIKSYFHGTNYHIVDIQKMLS